jgi:hypothetical protein
MATDPNNNPGSRMRSILSSEDKTNPAEEDSLLARLPRKSQPASKPAEAKASSSDSHAAPALNVEDVQPPPAHQHVRVSRTERTFRAFWTITGLMSLMVNGVLLAVVIYLLMSLNSLMALSDNKDLMILSGLYTNFQKMERASILANIPVDAQIPIDLTVPIQKTTQITLASDTTIANARVRINTATLNIDAPAQVILPSGTVLEVAMNFTVPVQGSVPVHLDVPVNIPLENTELRDPFVGLQAVVRPFLCILEPNTLNLDGQPVCR